MRWRVNRAVQMSAAPSGAKLPDSVEQAIAAHDGPGYQAALKELKGGVEREIRIVEALA